MKIILFDDSHLQKEKLPYKIMGNHSIKLENLDEIISIEENNGSWCINSNDKYKIFQNNQFVTTCVLNPCQFYNIHFEESSKNYTLYVLPICDESFNKFFLDNVNSIKIGKTSDCTICYDLTFLNNLNININYNNGIWEVSNLSNSLIFYNNEIINKATSINSGDGIFIYGLYIYFINNVLVINNPNNLVRINTNILKLCQLKPSDILPVKEKYFLKSPRLQTGVDLEDVAIDAPPEIQERQDSNMMMYVPMAIMGIAYVITGFNSISGVVSKKQSLVSALPSLAMTFAMLFGMLIWPVVLNKIKNKKTDRINKEGIKKYSEYLNKKEEIIVRNINNKKQVRLENYFSQSGCMDIIKNQKKELWNRDVTSDDFLTVRVGLGNEDLGFEIKYPEQKFSLKENNLFDGINNLKEKYKTVEKIPVLLSLYENNTIGIINEFDKGYDFLNYIIFQLMTYYSYDTIKFVTFTSEKNENLWEYMKILPHSWDDEKSFRYFASNIDEMKQISTELMEIYNYRNSRNLKEKNNIPLPYYFVIIDNLQDSRNLEIVKNVLSSDINNGFSIIVIDDTILKLPNECSKFINVGQKTSGIFERQLISNRQIQFANEMSESVNMYEYSRILASIKLSPNSSKNVNLPKKLSFLEMYNVGKIEQLNSLNKWENNNPIISLEAPIGLSSTGELLSLDLHEKFHGPHGLIAGTTGSGKSEFIITYILSMAVNYHPHEVSFILIDYKGGGLAGAFENSITKEKIPHLVGTITNLDKASINRTLVAIESELKRRQRIFNEARKYSNEGTVDIYKYQRMYREKIVDEPMPSLFIICDEFAELKTQQPEFMEQLISASRIGRSLGIHLILATQKPSGVVNDQIWSNSRFHICLKVQTESDSMEILKKKDAAFIKDTGRLYLQVGNDEIYLYGQSAYTGDKYIPTVGSYQKEDSLVSFIDNIGYEYKKMNNKGTTLVDSSSELISVVNYLIDLGKKEKIPVRQLWLDSIPERIIYNDLLKKYKYSKNKSILNLVIGEYDDPANQRQDLLTLPLTEEGNTLIFGVTGSGKEKLLSTMLFSGITTYHTDEVNFYILDFGSEVLRVFKDAPQVADYIISSEVEKVTNLFRLLYEELEVRKKLISDFGGNYVSYINKSSKPLPNIVVMINNYEAFNELYGAYEDALMKLTRDGLKYGIIFVIATNNSRSVRYNLRQNFAQNIGLRVNDAVDYYDVFGRISVIPSDYKGRGLIKKESVYEFQTATICEESKENDYISQVCISLSKQIPKALGVPVMPEEVSLNDIIENNESLEAIPIGVGVQDLDIVKINLEKEKIIPIYTQDISNITRFLRIFILETMKINKNNVLVFDLMQYMSGIVVNNYFTNNLEMYLNKLNNVNEKIVLFVLGFSKLKDNLKDNFKLFEELLVNAKSNDNIKIVLVDEISNANSCVFENWYKQNINKQNGIYIGNGVSQQTAIQIVKFDRSLDQEIVEDFGYLILNGKPKFIKFVVTEEYYE